MNSQAQHHGHAMSALSPAELDPIGLAEGLPASDSPTELKLGAVAIVIDQGGLIVAAEPICTALFLWEPTELPGQALEILLPAGTDNIRRQLAEELDGPGSDGEARPRLFALAQRKDGSSFPVAVTLERIPPAAGCWWAVAFHDVNATPVAQPEASVPQSASVPRRRRAQFTPPPGLDSIPDIFQRAPADPADQVEPPANAAPVAPEPPAPAAPAEPSPAQRTPAEGSLGSPSEPLPRVAKAPAAASAPPAAAPAPVAEGNSESRIQELEQRLSQSATDLKRTRGHVQQQDEQLHAAKVAAQQAEAALQEQRGHYCQLEEQLSNALQTGDELNHQLSAEQQARAEAEARVQDLDQRLAQTIEELQRAQTQIQQAPAPAPAPLPGEPDPALQEQLLEFEGRLRTAVTSLARATAELETERGERRRTDQRAATQAARMQQLHEELKNHLETEQIDRARLRELEHQLHDQTQQNDLTVAKLQSALQLEQCERKRLEAELHRSRFMSTDSVRAGRAQVNSLRRQLQSPAESLHQSACRLLQSQLSDEQKHVVQGMLESTLLLQTSLQESPEA